MMTYWEAMQQIEAAHARKIDDAVARLIEHAWYEPPSGGRAEALRKCSRCACYRRTLHTGEHEYLPATGVDGAAWSKEMAPCRPS